MKISCRVGWTHLSLSLNLVTLAVILGSCGHTPDGPTWNGKIWAGSSDKVGIERSQEKQVIQCGNPEFDRYIAMTYQDLGCIYEQYIQNVKEWKDPSRKCSGKISEKSVKQALQYMEAQDDRQD